MKSKKKDAGRPKPDMKWQVGKYDRHLSFTQIIPYQFLLLCGIVSVPPEQILTDFMDNLSCSSWKREGRDEVKEKLIDYFLFHGYGQEHYTREEIKQIFKEMDALGMLFPKNNPEMIEIYSKWRKKHDRYWFKKWFYKNQRKPLHPTPAT